MSQFETESWLGAAGKSVLSAVSSVGQAAASARHPIGMRTDTVRHSKATKRELGVAYLAIPPHIREDDKRRPSPIDSEPTTP
jgi:hypothetical protein